MKLRVNLAELPSIKGKAVFIDNDYLSILYSDEEIFEQTLKNIPGDFYIDPFVKFEFLRDVFDPEIRAAKEKFVDGFNVMPDHPELYNQNKEFALELSQIYASQKKAVGVSLVDLLLAAQLVKYSPNVLLITGNRKDYPAILFDLVTVLSYEQNNDSVRSISVLTLNTNNYSFYKQKLAEIKRKEIQKIEAKVGDIEK
jgi:predicted nucleic acid-binding protein